MHFFYRNSATSTVALLFSLLRDERLGKYLQLLVNKFFDTGPPGGAMAFVYFSVMSHLLMCGIHHGARSIWNFLDFHGAEICPETNPIHHKHPVGN